MLPVILSTGIQPIASVCNVVVWSIKSQRNYLTGVVNILLN